MNTHRCVSPSVQSHRGISYLITQTGYYFKSVRTVVFLEQLVILIKTNGFAYDQTDPQLPSCWTWLFVEEINK
jgi:hypothetical protein